MCLFPFANNNPKSIAYKKGVVEFNCGSCPECLSKKSRLWALRASMEAKVNKAAMITLTYDTFIRDDLGNIVGEKLPPQSQELSKRDAQLFMKRLRKAVEPQKIKYILTAERGKRTNRPHFHAIIFGFDFPDRVKYKKSKRGNIIYQSPFLEKVWGNGICTVDCVNISSKVARYCTKYCAKDSGVDDTFMLFSRGIGDEALMREFNGRSYYIDGIEYPIPKQIWNKQIALRYPQINGYDRYRSYSQYVESFDRKLNKSVCNYLFTIMRAQDLDPMRAIPLVDRAISYRADINTYKHAAYRCADLARFNARKRAIFRQYRDSDPLYQAYIRYWAFRADNYNATRPPVIDRIISLPNDKYFGYKQAALRVYASRLQHYRRFLTIDGSLTPPNSGLKSRRLTYLDDFAYQNGLPRGHLPFKPLVIKGQMTSKKKEKAIWKNGRLPFKKKRFKFPRLDIVIDPLESPFDYVQPTFFEKK